MPNILELATMSEVGIHVKDKCGGEKWEYVAARKGNLGSIYRLIRNCHLPELFGYPSPRSEVERI